MFFFGQNSTPNKHDLAVIFKIIFNRNNQSNKKYASTLLEQAPSRLAGSKHKIAGGSITYGSIIRYYIEIFVRAPLVSTIWDLGSGIWYYLVLMHETCELQIQSTKSYIF